MKHIKVRIALSDSEQNTGWDTGSEFSQSTRELLYIRRKQTTSHDIYKRYR